MVKVPEDIKPGKSFRVFYNEGNPNNCVYHIRAIVDDNQVVYRVWSYRKQRWNYNVRWMYWFELLAKEGTLQER